MGQAKGSKSKILVATETTFKSTPSPATGSAWILPFVSETFKMSRNLIDSKTIRSSRDAQKPARGNQNVAGDITFELAPCYARLFYHALGTVSTTGAGAPYTHTYKVSDLPAGITLEKQFLDLTPAQYFRYNGCKVNNIKMTVKPEGFIECTAAMAGALHTVTTTSFDSAPVTQNFNPWDGFGASLQEGGTTISVVTSFDFTINNNLDETVYVLDGTGQRYSLPEGIVKVDGTLTALFDSMTQYNKAVNNTETSLQIVLTQGDGTGGSAGNEKLTINIPELLFAPDSPVISGPTGVMVNLPFTAYYNDDAAASSVKFTLLSPLSSVI
jgi:hypothetical protein